MNYDIKRMNGIRREVEIEQREKYGPQHGKAGTMRSKRDKARCPRRQRKTRDWQREAA